LTSAAFGNATCTACNLFGGVFTLPSGGTPPPDWTTGEMCGWSQSDFGVICPPAAHTVGQWSVNMIKADAFPNLQRVRIMAMAATSAAVAQWISDDVIGSPDFECDTVLKSQTWTLRKWTSTDYPAGATPGGLFTHGNGYCVPPDTITVEFSD